MHNKPTVSNNWLCEKVYLFILILVLVIKARHGNYTKSVIFFKKNYFSGHWARDPWLLVLHWQGESPWIMLLYRLLFFLISTKGFDAKNEHKLIYANAYSVTLRVLHCDDLTVPSFIGSLLKNFLKQMLHWMWDRYLWRNT